ncbi:deacetylase [Ochromonadaceae sp. CCMP2298]|nr:deacetylase [Ochromonadaceae sp. CCMP2298]
MFLPPIVAPAAVARTGYVFEERYMWHDPGSIKGSVWMEPTEFWENVHTKRRLHNLLAVSGLLDHLSPLRARLATTAELQRFHTPRYVEQIQRMSKDGGGDAGEHVPFSAGGFEIASLSAGGVLVAVEAVLQAKVRNAYCLVRPPGHHAEADRGRGFCLFNNIALAALYARGVQGVTSEGAPLRVQRIAIVDYDVHHGNGTQDCFWNDPDCLFLSLHQHHNYPQDSGDVHDIGGPGAEGTTINLPLPPGSGSGAYRHAFAQVVLPALHRFKPDLILVSSGFDASFADPMASMMLSSEDYRYMSGALMGAAEQLCGGRVVFAHEGGYSKDYVPFCGLAVIETLSGVRTAVEDIRLKKIGNWGYQGLQTHQRQAVDTVAALHGLTGGVEVEGWGVEALVGVEGAATVEMEATQAQELAVKAQMQALLKLIKGPAQKRALVDSLL